ncbi:hypothetical protein BC830DRAFT_1136265 [Chytriomyces sp. MP71]|nr:hypothetical protein BC830DRAFT_1136265 [Chytriomyces sp. MP71]
MVTVTLDELEARDATGNRVVDHAHLVDLKLVTGCIEFLTQLPDSFASALPNLRTAFFSNCGFKQFPAVLARTRLERVAFKDNGMHTLAQDCLPSSTLRWLILTNNCITRLPACIGRCPRLEKCMLAGNQIMDLPIEMARCERLALLRISANEFEGGLPPFLLRMPALAFLAFAGNPTNAARDAQEEEEKRVLPRVAWDQLRIGKALGEGASGVICQAVCTEQTLGFQNADVAVKMFKGAVTSDGWPEEEMRAAIAAGQHENLITPVAEVVNHPEGAHGLVLPLIPAIYKNLGLPPSMDTCSRDVFVQGLRVSAEKAAGILKGVASACAHLHGRGISHGDLYAHNILVDFEEDLRDAKHEFGEVLLGDFGAAYRYDITDKEAAGLWEKLEVLAFAHLVEDVMGLVDAKNSPMMHSLAKLHVRCSVRDVASRPSFRNIVDIMAGL